MKEIVLEYLEKEFPNGFVMIYPRDIKEGAYTIAALPKGNPALVYITLWLKEKMKREKDNGFDF